MFDITPASAAPIWRQIEEGMRRMISLGTLVPGDAVPSVRDLAQQLRVNPNTVARAYRLLEEQGVILTAGRKGTFVRRGASREVDKARATEAQRALRRLVDRLSASGLSRDQISSIFQQTVRAPRAKGSS